MDASRRTRDEVQWNRRPRSSLSSFFSTLNLQLPWRRERINNTRRVRVVWPSMLDWRNSFKVYQHELIAELVYECIHAMYIGMYIYTVAWMTRVYVCLMFNVWLARVRTNVRMFGPWIRPTRTSDWNKLNRRRARSEVYHRDGNRLRIYTCYVQGVRNKQVWRFRFTWS